MDVLVGVHVVKRHAIVNVLCHLVVNVVIGVHIVVLFGPAYCCPLCVPIVILYQFIQLFTRSHSFTKIFTHGILGVVFTMAFGYEQRNIDGEAWMSHFDI